MVLTKEKEETRKMNDLDIVAIVLIFIVGYIAFWLDCRK